MDVATVGLAENGVYWEEVYRDERGPGPEGAYAWCEGCESEKLRPFYGWHEPLWCLDCRVTAHALVMGEVMQGLAQSYPETAYYQQFVGC